MVSKKGKPHGKRWILYGGTQDRLLKYQSNGSCGQCAVSGTVGGTVGGTCKTEEMRMSECA
jgi:hypothetical protein